MRQTCFLGVLPSQWRIGASVVVLGILFGVVCLPVGAAPWYLDASVDAGLGYNDNPEFATSEEIDSDEIPDGQAYGIVGGRMEFGSETTASGAALVLAAQARRYQDDESLDSEYLHAGLIMNGTGQSSDYSVELGATQDSTLESELTDTGRFDDNVDRRDLYFRPTIERRFSSRTSASLGFGYSRVEFDNNNDDLVDYDELSSDLGFTHQLTERTSGTFDIVWLDYQPRDEDTLMGADITRDRSLQLLVGAEHRLTQRSRLTWRLGPDFRETKFADDRENETTDDMVYRIGYVFEDGPNTTGIEIYNTEVSSADGGLELVQGLSMDFARAVSPLATVGIDLSFEQSDPVRGELAEREYLEVNPWAEWQVGRSIALRFNLFFREQEFSGTPLAPAESADQNVALLELRYTWDRRYF